MNFDIVLNIVTATLIVVANKLCFRESSDGGKGIVFTLTGFHFLVTFVVLHFLRRASSRSEKENLSVDVSFSLFFSDILPVSLLSCLFLVTTNASLEKNPVVFYQLLKTLTAPVVVFLQWAFFSVHTSRWNLLALLVSCVGLFISFGLSVEASGLLIGVSSVLATAVFQILVNTKQEKTGMAPIQFLYCQMPVSFVVLFCLGFYRGEFSASLLNRRMVFLLCVSSLLSIGVNVSSFSILGKTSPITYNFVGYFKTVLTMLCGVLFFGERMSLQKCFGVGMTLAGVVWHAVLEIRGK
ncbi:MAG: putative triose-phosphate transporter family protein [Amphiamblys sp. WSBS2006]|nr:MAG: putative triose-phosphate transporter family protein [Amphiamblys sp. WSBS2006]